MTFLASLMNFGGPDLIVILLIVLVLFGAKRLPDLARGMGQAMKEFQKAKDDLSQELRTPGNARTQAILTKDKEEELRKVIESK
jgi:sec-independent protein translocase protein TatA